MKKENRIYDSIIKLDLVEVKNFVSDFRRERLILLGVLRNFYGNKKVFVTVLNGVSIINVE